jgi:hypothetical protein
MRNIVIIILITLIIITILILTGCSNEVSIKDIHKNSEEYMGKEITTSGIVNKTTKILSFSGFLLQDKEGQNSIFVQVPGESGLPAEGSYVQVIGTLQKGILGHHIYASEVIER